MSKLEVPLKTLETYLPKGAYEPVEKYLIRHKVQLTVTRERTSILGNYQGAFNGKNHRISVNGNLNKYSFLITLIHELAHLLTYEKYGARVQAHGAEWKKMYSSLMSGFITNKLFPRDIERELISSLDSPSASSCTEDSLLRVLRKYDPPKPGFFLLEELSDKSVFRTRNGVLYRRMYQIRKRILCVEEATSRKYLFSPVAEVELVRKK